MGSRNGEFIPGPPQSNPGLTPKKFKVVLLGEGAVGKTSLVLRYIENKFNPQHISTIQASYLVKRLNVDGSRAELAIWDTAGQERFHALGPIYYRGSHGAVLVYDITDVDSFERVKSWVKELRKMLGAKVVLGIAGNKIDLEATSRTVSHEDAETFAQSVDAMHFETSAKTSQGVEELFLQMSKKMLEVGRRNSATSPSNPGGSSANAGRSIQVVDDPPPPENKSCCGGMRKS